MMGAQILRFTPATGVSRRGDDWIVHTDKGDITAKSSSTPQATTHRRSANGSNPTAAAPFPWW